MKIELFTNLDCGSLIICEQSLGKIKNTFSQNPLKSNFSKKLSFDQLSPWHHGRFGRASLLELQKNNFDI